MKTEAELRDALRWMMADLRRMDTDGDFADMLFNRPALGRIATTVAWVLGEAGPGFAPAVASLDEAIAACRQNEETAKYPDHPKTANTLRIKKRKRKG